MVKGESRLLQQVLQGIIKISHENDEAHHLTLALFQLSSSLYRTVETFAQNQVTWGERQPMRCLSTFATTNLSRGDSVLELGTFLCCLNPAGVGILS